MNCANHPEIPATAFCRECGKPMCPECQKPALGSIYCAEHLPAPASAFVPPQPPPIPPETPRVTPPPPPPYATAPNPYTAPAPPPHFESDGHPVLALILGFIPGVGAIYNGQYAKGLIHVVVFGLLVSLLNRGAGPFEPLFAILLAAWVFYMAFEAFHTARKKKHGIPVEEFSSLLDVRTSNSGRFSAGAIVLIILGFILLLDTTDIISMDQLERYWPIGLIAFGLYLLYARLSPGHAKAHADRSVEAQK